jgi:hypothetical protein
MLLLSDCRLDDHGVVGIGDQADDKVVLRELGIQSLVVGNIERDRGSIFDTDRERLGGFECPASCRSVSGLIVKHPFGRGKPIPTVTEMPESERISRVGLVTKPAPSINTLRSIHREYKYVLNAGRLCLTCETPL